MHFECANRSRPQRPPTESVSGHLSGPQSALSDECDLSKRSLVAQSDEPRERADAAAVPAVRSPERSVALCAPAARELPVRSVRSVRSGRPGTVDGDGNERAAQSRLHGGAAATTRSLLPEAQVHQQARARTTRGAAGPQGLPGTEPSFLFLPQYL